MALLCGIDDAGRGPVIGPMVLAGVLIDEKDDSRLKALGVGDSKKFTPEQRNRLYTSIIGFVKNYKAVIVPPSEIDDAVSGKGGLNLNWLEAKASAEIIRYLKPDTVIVDAPTSNTKAFANYLSSLIPQNVRIISENKADVLYPTAGAASIIAKVTRDKEISKIEYKIGKPIGSGYPSDPKTKAFIKENFDRYPDIFRKSWATYRAAAGMSAQKTLQSFSRAPEQHKKKIGLLKNYGFAEQDPKTEYETARLKGACTVVFYTNGKILVQGKKKEKETTEKLLGIS